MDPKEVMLTRLQLKHMYRERFVYRLELVPNWQ